jgi:hypothetical protein
MARTLSYHQQDAVQRVHTANARKRELRERIDAEVRARFAADLRAAELEESRAARLALDLGVSKATIGREGLHTKDPYAVNRVLELTGDTAPAEVVPFRALTADERAEHRVPDGKAAAEITVRDADLMLKAVVVQDADGWWDAVGGPDQHRVDEMLEPGSGLASALNAWAR